MCIFFARSISTANQIASHYFSTFLFYSDVQGETNWTSANWYFGGDPCPIKTYKWTVYNDKHAVVQPEKILPGGESNVSCLTYRCPLAISQCSSYLFVNSHNCCLLLFPSPSFASVRHAKQRFKNVVFKYADVFL